MIALNVSFVAKSNVLSLQHWREHPLLAFIDLVP